MATVIQIRNITVLPVDLTGTELDIEGLTTDFKIPAGLTRLCFNTPERVFQDVTLRNAVNSDLVQIVMGGMTVPKNQAIQKFDAWFNADAYTVPRLLTAASGAATDISIADTLLMADVAAAGGTQTVSLPPMAANTVGKTIEVLHLTDGALTIQRKTTGQINVFGTLQNNIISRQTNAVYKFVSDGSNWILTSVQGVNYLHHWRGREYADRTIVSVLLINGTINDWDILVNNPNARKIQVASAGVTDITGIINPNTQLPRVIEVNVTSGTVNFLNNNAGSTLGYRFSIGANIAVTASTFPFPKFNYNSGTGQVWTK